MIHRGIRLLFVLSALFAALSCRPSLPKHGEPTARDAEPSAIREGDLIAYRTLSPEDFRAEAPPPEMKQYAEKMGAVTCSNVFTEPDPQYFIEELPQGGFKGAYLNLSFVARMDRGCSWWNPSESSIPESYILQHEQIHFALSELTARELNTLAAEVLESFVVVDSSSQAVGEKLQKRVRTMMDESMEALLKRNLQFDRDTSNKYAPKVQQRWYDETVARL